MNELALFHKILCLFVSGQETSVVKMRVNVAVALSLATALVGCCLAEIDNSVGVGASKVAPLSEEELEKQEQQMIDTARSTNSPSNLRMFKTNNQL